MVLDADGGAPRSLIDDVALTGVPCDWSPDGLSILVGRTDGSMSVVSQKTSGRSALQGVEGLDRAA